MIGLVVVSYLASVVFAFGFFIESKIFVTPEEKILAGLGWPIASLAILGSYVRKLPAFIKDRNYLKHKRLLQLESLRHENSMKELEIAERISNEYN